MNYKILLTAVTATLLAGCTMGGGAKKAAVLTPAAPKPVVVPAPAPPPAPPPPLSIPQTRVELPKPQPLDQSSLPDETEPVVAPPGPTETPAAPARSRRTTTPAQPQAEPAATPPATEPRETFREVVTETEKTRLKDRIANNRRAANQVVTEFARRQQTTAQKDTIANIKSFLALSAEAEKQNDFRQADALAERAQILAKELQSGQ